MRVVLHPDADREFRRAAFWYEERSPGLGDEFVASVSEALRRIGERPRSFPPWLEALTPSGEPIRRAVLRRFPYIVAFEIHSEHLLVLAAEESPRPRYQRVVISGSTVIKPENSAKSATLCVSR